MAKKITAKEKKPVTKEKKPVTKNNKEVDLKPWGLEVEAVAHSLSGNIAADIEKLLKKAVVEEALLRAAIKKLDKVVENPDSLPEEIDAAAASVKQYQADNIIYRAPLNVIHRDVQRLGSDDNPLPIICQHFILAAFRDEASASFPREFGLVIAGEKTTGLVGRGHLRKYIRVTPYHIFLYKDPEYKEMFEASDITVEGQQPVMDVKGFSYNEVMNGPIYFKFQMIFQPKGKFPGLANKDNVIQCLYQSTFRGLGGRRAANYGQWDILKATILEFSEPPFVIEGVKNERNSIPN